MCRPPQLGAGLGFHRFSFFLLIFCLLHPPEDGGAEGRQKFWAADGTGYGWLAEEGRNRRKTEEKRKREKREKKEEISEEGRGDFAGAEDVRRGARDRERGRTGPTHQGFSLGSGMILIHFASLVLNCSPLFLVSVWIPLTSEDHLCNLFSALGRL